MRVLLVSGAIGAAVGVAIVYALPYVMGAWG